MSKKYRSLIDDLETFQKELQENPLQGTDLGGGVRKIRMTIASKGKGKSGGPCAHSERAGERLMAHPDFSVADLHRPCMTA